MRVYFNCDNCNEPTSQQASAYKRKGHHFCSKECYAHYRSNTGLYKLTADDVKKIKELYHVHGLKQQAIAYDFNINQTHVSRIVNGLTFPNPIGCQFSRENAERWDKREELIEAGELNDYCISYLTGYTPTAVWNRRKRIKETGFIYKT